MLDAECGPLKTLLNSDQNQSACNSWTQLPDVEFQWPNKDKGGGGGDINIDGFDTEFLLFLL